MFVSMLDRRTAMNDQPSGLSARAIRVSWLALALIATAGFVAALASQWATLRTTCHSDADCAAFQLNAASGRVLAEHGISLTAYAMYTVAISALFWMLWVGTAWVIIHHKPRDRGALFTAFGLLVGSAWLICAFVPGAANLGGSISLSLLFLFGLLFPDGRFAPSWTRLLAVVGVLAAIQVAIPLLPAVPIFIALFLAACGVAAVLIYRYRHLFSWSEQRQTRWVVLGFAATTVLYIATAAPFVFTPGITGYGSLYDGFANITGTAVAVAPLPISIGIAVLRSGLWDIDRLINRALVYLSMTVTLGVLYIAIVLGLQAVFRGITGQNSDLAVAAATLGIAALFTPWHRRLQRIVDRRFYRRRYDAVRTLAAFNVRLRDEVDLDQLGSDLIAVVGETMQPSGVGLWVGSHNTPA